MPRIGRKLPAWIAITDEGTSGTATLIACGLVYLAMRAAPLGRAHWSRVLLVHGLTSVLFSGVHVAGMMSLRVIVFATQELSYKLPMLGDLIYEYRKDLKLYPSANMQESILAGTRDAIYGWTAERLVTKQAALGQPSYLYLFDHGFPAADNAGLHAFHASEVPFVFGTLNRTPAYWPKAPPTADEAKLSDAMVGYWTSFAKTGDPKAAGEPDWPRFGPSGGFMAFQAAPQAYGDLFPGMYALHEAVVCRRRASGDLSWNWNMGLASPPLPPKAAGC